MTLPRSRGDKDDQCFKETSAGNVARRICTDATDPLHVQLVDDIGDDTISIYDSVSSVASSATATVVSYTVPVGMTLFIKEIEFAGNNIANYTVEIAATVEAKRRTWFGGDISGEFRFYGLQVSAGSTVVLKAENFRPSVADFEGRIVGALL